MGPHDEWFDSHCHVHLCETGSPEEIIGRARAAGVVEMLTVGIDLPSSRSALEIAGRRGVYACVGIHPNSAAELSPDTWAAIERLAADERSVAVGETGLDFYRDHASPERQRAAFEAHIELAKARSKTLVIHTRDSTAEALDVLQSAGPPERLIFHCWSADEHQLQRAVAMGAFISFAGNVSFKNAPELRSAARATPADRLLVETDSPYLTPMPNRGKPNEPRHVVFVGAAVAEARAMSGHEVAALTTANARRAFAL